ncbi:nuclear FMR1 interacting protein 1 isoform X2 [Oratosquilla oratoria]
MEDFASPVGPHPKGPSNGAHTSDGSQENYWMQMNQTYATTAPASGASGSHGEDQVYQYYGQYHDYSNQYDNHYYYRDPYGQHQRSQNRLACEVCNRSFFNEAKLQQHIEGHVKCPFPECGLEADMKIIDQHITNQHMLVNFEALQMDDEAWIAERKKRFPTAERAALRRAQQEQQLKRGERLQPNKKRFNKDAKPVSKPKFADKKKPSKDAKTSETEQFKGRGKRGTWKKDEKKEKFSRPVPVVDVDPYDSDPEVKRGVPAFKGTKQYYESTGEVSYFVNYNKKIDEEEEEDLSEEVIEDGLNISDEEEWQSEQAKENCEPTPSESTKIVLSNALGSLIGAYDSDSEEEESMESHNIQPTVDAKEVVKQSTVAPSPCTQKETGEEVKSNETSHNLRENKGRHPRRRHGRRKRPAKDNESENADGGVTNDSRPRPKQPRFPRKRKATLLEKLLESDIRHERNVILQCIRYIINNKFFDSAKETVTEGEDKKDDEPNGSSSVESEPKEHLDGEKIKEIDPDQENVEASTANISDSKNDVEDRIVLENQNGKIKVGLVNVNHLECEDIEKRSVEQNDLGTKTKNQLESEDNVDNGMEIDHQKNSVEFKNQDRKTKVGLVNVNHLECEDIEKKSVEQNDVGAETKNQLGSEDNVDNGMEIDHQKNSVELETIDQMECETKSENYVQNNMKSKAALESENGVEGMKVTDQKTEDSVKSVTNEQVKCENKEKINQENGSEAVDVI